MSTTIHVTLDWPTDNPHAEMREVEERISAHPVLKDRLEWLGHGTGAGNADVGYTTTDAWGILPLFRAALAGVRIENIRILVRDDEGETIDVTVLNDPEDLPN